MADLPFSPDEWHVVQGGARLMDSTDKSVEAEDAVITQLTRGIAAGREESFRELFDRYHDRLFRLLMVFARGDEGLARELVQSVMLTAAAKLGPLRTETHLWNWLAKVARQQCAKRQNQIRREGTVLSFGDCPEVAAESAPDRELEQALDTALHELDEQNRNLIEMFYYDKLSQQEIAERHGTTAKAISSRLERLRHALRGIIVRNLKNET
jgi:RNA polymerase sigma factor (sigma-70 family)